MKSLILLSLLSSGLAFGQLSTYTIKGKTGVKYDNKIVAKAKYDKVLLLDEDIATAFKKNKTYYIDSDGDVFYKGKTSETSTFEYGMGIIKGKKKMYHIIDVGGDQIDQERYSIQKPKRVGGAVEFTGNPGAIYNDDGSFFARHDSVVLMDNWLLVYTTEEVKRYTKIRKLFRIKTEIEIIQVPSATVFSKNGYYKYANQVSEIDSMRGLRVLTTIDSNQHLFTEFGELVAENLRNIEPFEENYIIGDHKSGKTLVNTSEKKLYIKGAYEKFEVKENIIFAFSTFNNKEKVVDIYSGDSLVQSDWKFIEEWDELSSVFSDSTGKFVAWNNGDKRSRSYVNFNEPTGYYMMVKDSASYTWLDVDIFAEREFHYPFLTGDYTRRKGPGPGFVDKLFYMSFLGWIGDKDTTTRIIIDSGNEFHDGWAIVPTNAKSAKKPFLEPVFIGDSKNIRYNFINIQNKRLNDKKYEDCLSFSDGRAWVKEKGMYHQIDQSGKKVGKLRFKYVRRDENGYFIVGKTTFNEDLIGPDFKPITTNNRTQIYQKGRSYYVNSDCTGRPLYAIP
jgi:hypothetical protein